MLFDSSWLIGIATLFRVPRAIADKESVSKKENTYMFVSNTKYKLTIFKQSLLGYKPKVFPVFLGIQDAFPKIPYLHEY